MKHTLIALVPLLLSAQEMTGPTLGWWATDDGRRLQAIHGVAGAARMGPASEWPKDLSGLVVSPSGNRAAALLDGVPILIDLASGQRTTLSDATRADTIVWSPLGSALLTADRRTGHLRTYVQRGAHWEAQLELTWPADEYAVSDDGRNILGTVGEELLLQGTAGIRVIGPKSAAFTFLAATDVPVVGGGPDLAIGNSRASLPAGDYLVASAAPNRVLLVERAMGKIYWFDAQGKLLAEGGCACTVERLEYIGAPGSIRLVTESVGPAWLAETSELNQRLFFIPNQQQVEP